MGGKQAKVLHYQAQKCNTLQQLEKVQFTDKLEKYIQAQQDKPNHANLQMFKAKAAVRGNDTGNAVEGTHAADKPARSLPMAEAMQELHYLHQKRYNKNRAEAFACEHLAPPRVQEKMETIIEKAQHLRDVRFMNDTDDVSRAKAARVSKLNGTGNVTSCIHRGDFNEDVKCSCGYPAARGLPCIHNVKHALTMNIDPYALLHYKDTTAAWQEQYMMSMPVDFPLVTPADYDHALIDPELHYPPIPPPKVGRPKKTGRIKSVKESTRKRGLPVCTSCGELGHNKRNIQCVNHPKNPNKKGRGKGGKGQGRS